MSAGIEKMQFFGGSLNHMVNAEAEETVPLLGDAFVRPMGIVEHRAAARTGGPLTLDSIKSVSMSVGNCLLGILGVTAGAALAAPFVVIGKVASGLYSLAAKTNLPPTISVAVDGNNIEFSTEGYPRIPRGQEALADFKQDIQRKIFDGARLLRDINDDNFVARPCTLRDMTNIMTCLQARGEQKVGEKFTQGSFTLPDPGQRLRKFLDTCPAAYQRLSSHVDEFQKLPGGKHRGIDAGGGGDHYAEQLPRGKSTLLYGSLSQNEGLHMPEDRIFLKIEDHGCFLSAGRDSEGPHRMMRMHDVGHFYGHAVGFIRSSYNSIMGKNSPAGSYKERIPPHINGLYKALVANVPDNNPDLRDKLNRGDPTSTAGGIRVMLANVNNALETCNFEHNQEMEDWLAAFRMNFLAGENNVPPYQGLDHPNLRIGQEIIFTTADLH